MSERPFAADGTLARRAFLRGVGAMALGPLGLETLLAMEGPTDGQRPHFPPRAKRVIFLTQSGGPSQLELFDPKPRLVALAGQPLPESVRGGQRVTGMTKGKPQLVLPSRAAFAPRGQCGTEMSDWIPHIGSIADKICLVRSMVTDQINHAPAMTKFLTGHQLPGRPSLGSWASYGLGRISEDLPSYVVLITKMMRGSDQPLYDHYWGNGFLPASHQGVRLRSLPPIPCSISRTPRAVLSRAPPRAARRPRRPQSDPRATPPAIPRSSRGSRSTSSPIACRPASPSSRISARSRTRPSSSMDRTRVAPGSYAANCILARRMIERGVRFVQLFHPDWDHHSRLTSWCQMRCRDTDQPTAALRARPQTARSPRGHTAGVGW